MNYSRKEFGARLLARRQKCELTLADLAERVGVVFQAIHRYEKGTSSPSLEVAVKLAEALGTSLDYLTGATDSPKRQR